MLTRYKHRSIAMCMKQKIVLGLVLVMACFGLSQCNNEAEIWQDDDKIKVVATSTMVTDLVSIIGGDQVQVIGLMKAEVDPHSYEQTARDVAAMNSAAVIFYSGLHLEGHLQEGLEKRASKGNVYAVTQNMKPTDLIQPEEDYASYADPHVWGDPELWAMTVDVVVEALSKQTPQHAAVFKQRGDNYREELLALKAWSQKRIDEVSAEQRILVTSHDAFFYFARAYGFEVKGLQGLSTENVSGIKDVDDLISYIQQKKLKMIFPESSVNRKGIEIVAKKAGVKLSSEELFSDSMGEHGDVVEYAGESYDRGTYIGMQKHNINTIVDGLK